MLFRGPMGAGAASGKMGAMVASHNKGGQYLRARVKPSGAVASAQQQAVRNALATLATCWSSVLNDDQRSAWEVYASNVKIVNRIGDTIQISGENWYIACNTPRLQAQLPRVDDAPTTFDRGTVAFPALNATMGGEGIVVTFGGTVTAPANILVYQGKPYSDGRGKYYGSFQLADICPISGGATSLTLAPVFPLPDTSSKCDFKLVVTQDDGRLATPLAVTFQG